MSADEDFLARWSRRKREAADEKVTAAPQEPVADTTDQSRSEEARKDNSKDNSAPEAFDPASLPPIESISALSDIRDFLRAGVPAELTRAALRRVWTLDPGIRDFVGLAENAWDFTDPNAMPGFGPLDAGFDARAAVARILDAGLSDTAQSASETEVMRRDFARNEKAQVTQAADKNTIHAHVKVDAVAVRSDNPSDNPGEQNVAVGGSPSHESDAATQKATNRSETQSQKIVRRSHGSALPH